MRGPQLQEDPPGEPGRRDRSADQQRDGQRPLRGTQGDLVPRGDRRNERRAKTDGDGHPDKHEARDRNRLAYTVLLLTFMR